MVNLNYTLFIQIANFIVLIFILNRFLYKPILRVMESRKKLFDETEAETGRLEQSIEQKTEEYELKLQQARKASLADREERKAEGSETAREILAKSSTETAKVIDEFRGKIEKEKEQARAILREQTRKIATEISEKILGRAVQ